MRYEQAGGCCAVFEYWLRQCERAVRFTEKEVNMVSFCTLSMANQKHQVSRWPFRYKKALEVADMCLVQYGRGTLRRWEKSGPITLRKTRTLLCAFYSSQIKRYN